MALASELAGLRASPSYGRSLSGKVRLHQSMSAFRSRASRRARQSKVPRFPENTALRELPDQTSSSEDAAQRRSSAGSSGQLPTKPLAILIDG